MDLKSALGVLLIAASIGMLGCAAAPTKPEAQRSDTADAQSRVDQAAAIIDRMRSEPGTAALLQNARGVLIVPDYARATSIVGGQGGVGVLAERYEDRWSDPAFFSVGGLSVGLQTGGVIGAVAYVLMTPKALEQFEIHNNRFSLAHAGLTVVKYSGSATGASSTVPDVIVWTTGTTDLSGGVSFDVTQVVINSTLDEAYYLSVVSVREILDGSAHNRQAQVLRQSLATHLAQQ